MTYEMNRAYIGLSPGRILRRAVLGAALAVGMGGAGVAFAQQSESGQSQSAAEQQQAQQAAQQQRGQQGQGQQGRVQQEDIRKAIQQGEEIDVKSNQIAQIVVLFPVDQASLRASAAASGGKRVTRTDQQRRSGASASNALSLIFVAEDGIPQQAQSGQGQEGQQAQGQQEDQARQAGQKQRQGQQGQSIDPNAVAVLTAAESANGVATLAVAPNRQDQKLRVAAMMGGNPVRVSSGSKQGNMHVLTIKGQGGASGGQSGQAGGQSAQQGQSQGQGQSADAVVLVYLSDIGSQAGQSGSGSGSTPGQQPGQ